MFRLFNHFLSSKPFFNFLPTTSSYSTQPPPSGFVDTFGRNHNYLRISLTERCNLRCTYCMPAEGVPLTSNPQLLQTPELLKLVKVFADQGVRKIRFTGGEPTLRGDLADILSWIRQHCPQISTLAMTTNGLVLSRKLPALREAGLNALNISLDTLDPNKFTLLTRRQGHDRVLGAIEKSLALGFAPLKVNCVVIRGVNDDEVPAFVQMTQNQALDIRFIEYMPFDGNQWKDSKLVPTHELIDKIEKSIDQKLQPIVLSPNETARSYRIPNYQGTVSFISSMTNHFCGTCNRLRLTADGNLKVCLFGNSEVSLRDILRSGASDEELVQMIRSAVQRKKAAHAGMYELAESKNRPMILIGG